MEEDYIYAHMCECVCECVSLICSQLVRDRVAVTAATKCQQSSTMKCGNPPTVFHSNELWVLTVQNYCHFFF
jgi:hypothetical protein